MSRGTGGNIAKRDKKRRLVAEAALRDRRRSKRSALAARSGEPKAKSGVSPTERKRATKGSDGEAFASRNAQMNSIPILE